MESEKKRDGGAAQRRKTKKEEEEKDANPNQKRGSLTSVEGEKNTDEEACVWELWGKN